MPHETLKLIDEAKVLETGEPLRLTIAMVLPCGHIVVGYAVAEQRVRDPERWIADENQDGSAYKAALMGLTVSVRKHKEGGCDQISSLEREAQAAGDLPPDPPKVN